MVAVIFFVQNSSKPQENYTENINQYFIPIKIKKKNDTFISRIVYIFKQ